MSSFLGDEERQGKILQKTTENYSFSDMAQLELRHQYENNTKSKVYYVPLYTDLILPFGGWAIHFIIGVSIQQS